MARHGRLFGATAAIAPVNASRSIAKCSPSNWLTWDNLRAIGYNIARCRQGPGATLIILLSALGAVGGLAISLAQVLTFAPCSASAGAWGAPPRALAAPIASALFLVAIGG